MSGRLLRVHDADTSVLARHWVVAHRVGERAQGPVDSQRTDAGGRFRFVIARPESAAAYVVSSRWQGIGYFSDPLPTAGPAAPLDLAVFDTAAIGPPLRLGMRHLVITRGDAGTRRVLDIFQVENGQRTTRVGPDSTAAVWTAALPDGIESPEAGESDITASAIRFERGRVLVSAPFPPGPKQVVISYRLPAGARQLEVPVDQPTARLEILVEDSTATASRELAPDEPVAIEGRTFRRFGADSLAAGATPRLSFAATGGKRRDWSWIAIVFTALALAGATVYALRRRAGAAPLPGPRTGDRPELAGESDERLVAQLAALDDKFAGREAGTASDDWLNYQRRRAALKAELERRVARR
jgi:hypothetical protein